MGAAKITTDRVLKFNLPSNVLKFKRLPFNGSCIQAHLPSNGPRIEIQADLPSNGSCAFAVQRLTRGFTVQRVVYSSAFGSRIEIQAHLPSNGLHVTLTFEPASEGSNTGSFGVRDFKIPL